MMSGGGGGGHTPGYRGQPKQASGGKRKPRKAKKIWKGQLVNGGNEPTVMGQDEGYAEGMDDEFDELSLDTIKEIDPIQE